MTILDYHVEIEKLNNDFMNNPYFSALSIMTPRDQWLFIQKSAHNASETSEEARRRGITNVVVTEGETVLGYIRHTDLEKKSMDKVKRIQGCKIPEGMKLFQLVEVMVKDSRAIDQDDAPLYFITRERNEREDIIGILTFWDLNRAPSYVLTYSILAAIEQTLLLKIRESHKEWRDHTETLRKIDTEELKRFDSIKKFVSGPEYDFGKLDEWDLKGLWAFYKHDPHIISKFDNSLEELIKILISGTRNRVGHPVKFMIRDDGNFKDDLENLSKVWKDGKKFFSDFLNPKVRHKSRP
jgi:hypothetical protein